MSKLMYSMLLVTAFVHGGGGLSRCKGPEEEGEVVKLRKVGPVVDSARELVVGWKEISELVQIATTGNHAFASLLSRQAEFACKEGENHDRLCACQGSRVLTMESLLSSAVYGHLGIWLFPVDIDSSTHQLVEGLSPDAILYNFSKARLYVQSWMDRIMAKYKTVLDAERGALAVYAKKMVKAQKDQRKSVASSVVALACGCKDKRRHRSCIQSMINATAHQKCTKCLSCKVIVTSTLEDSLHNIVFPQKGDSGSCAICRKKLWKWKKR